MQLGAIPTFIIIGGCYFVGRSIVGRKIKIDELATEAYKKYMEQSCCYNDKGQATDP